MSDCICRLKQQECQASVHDYAPIPVECDAVTCRGYDAAIREVVAYLRKNRAYWLERGHNAGTISHREAHYKKSSEFNNVADALERGEHQTREQA